MKLLVLNFYLFFKIVIIYLMDFHRMKLVITTQFYLIKANLKSMENFKFLFFIKLKLYYFK